MELKSYLVRNSIVKLFIRAKIKSQFTKFKGNEISIEGNNSTLFSIILLDPVFL